MKKYIAILVIIILPALCYTQTLYETIDSEKLEETKELKIQLPRNYNTNEEKIYPIILVLDGDYLFEPIAGNVDYYSYWEEMPEAIVVGINHKGMREKDTSFDLGNFLPADRGIEFFEFIGMELMPYLDETFRTANFAIIVGHDITANFINYYLLKDKPMFKGYINLSPDYVDPMPEWLFNTLSTTSEKLWFYQATGSEDIKHIRETVSALDLKLKDLDNNNLHYFADHFPEASHYSLVGHAIPSAIKKFFTIYGPISKKEYDEVILPMETSTYDYLIEKYNTINNLFGLEKTIRINDFIAVATAMEKNLQWEDLEQLGKLAQKEHPNSMLGNYFLGRSYEENGSPKKAYRAYQNAFILEEVAFVTKDLVLGKAEKLKADFGF